MTPICRHSSQIVGRFQGSRVRRRRPVPKQEVENAFASGTPGFVRQPSATSRSMLLPNGTEVVNSLSTQERLGFLSNKIIFHLGTSLMVSPNRSPWSSNQFLPGGR